MEIECGVKVIALAIWAIIAAIVISPVYARADEDERIQCIVVYAISFLYAIKKVVE